MEGRGTHHVEGMACQLRASSSAPRAAEGIGAMWASDNGRSMT